MNLQFKNARFELEPGQFLTLDDSLGMTIACREGALWITQDGDPRDMILTGGHQYRVDRPTRVMVFATSASTFQISSAAASAQPDVASRASFLEWLIGTPAATSRVVSAPRIAALAGTCPT